MASPQGIRAGRAFVELFADDTKLVRGLRRAERRLRAFGDRIRNLGLKVAGIGTAVIAPLAASAKFFSGYGDQVAKMARRTGLSVAALSELQFAADQSGTSLEALETGVRRMQRSIYDAGRGLSTQVDALKDLGLAFEDLDGLSPQQQFKALAEAVSRIEDPTRKAALAQALFGRAGTQLLPMMASGAKGIEALQQRARELGLTMSGQDARAAEDLADAFDRLWKVVKMGTFNIGAALAPVLEKMADTITRVVVTINHWIKNNRQLVVQVLKIAASVTATGVALIALGVLVSGVGAAMGVLASIITAVGTAFSVLAGAIGLLVSPIGIVMAALGALGAYLVQTTGVAGQALAWLGERFGVLKDTALKAYQAMADALAGSGGIALAARILWLKLKLEWTKGVNYLEGIWLSFKYFLIDVLASAFAGAVAALQMIWHGLEVAWIETTAFLIREWYGFVNIFMHSWERMRALATKVWNWIKGLFNDSIDVRAANAQIDRALEQRLAQIDQDTGEAVIGAELGRQTRRRRAGAIHEQTLGVIGQRNQNEQDRQARQRAEAELEAQHALIAARQEWEQAIAEAKQGRSGVDSDVTGTSQLPGAAGIGDLIASEAARISSAGSFHAVALQGLAFDGDVAKRTADAAEATARNTKRLTRQLNEGGLSFT